MTDLLAPIGLTVLAVAAMSLCMWPCVRGLRRGDDVSAAADPDELQRARAELAELTRDVHADTDAGTARIRVPTAERDQLT